MVIKFQRACHCYFMEKFEDKCVLLDVIVKLSQRDAPDLNGRKNRCGFFGVSRGDAWTSFEVQEYVLDQML